jgi:hypothetical protein
MEGCLGVTVGCLTTLEYQSQRSLKSDTLLAIGGHLTVVGIPGILAIDHGCHLLEGVEDLVASDDTVMQPVGNVLARNAQRCPVFHQGEWY